MSEKGPYMNSGVNPICEQERTSCNRIYGNACTLLTNTHFNKPCPFYKKNDPKEVKKRGK